MEIWVVSSFWGEGVIVVVITNEAIDVFVYVFGFLCQ